MQANTRRGLIGIPLVLLLITGVAVAGSVGGARLGELPLFALAAILAVAIQWLAFLPAFLAKTANFYDLIGSLSFIAITITLVALAPAADTRTFVLAAMVIVWALRLGSYLTIRMAKSGRDDRFDDIIPSAPRFLLTWTMQAAWIVFTAMAAWIAITSERRVGADVLLYLGGAVWLLGFIVEWAADAQKARFRANPANKGTFIHTGIWAWSRHPNYFGEIVTWVGVFIAAAPVLVGWQWVAVLSPLFVTLLLTKVSGVPLLEKKAEKRWGDDPAYQAYRDATPVLVPKPPKR